MSRLKPKTDAATNVWDAKSYVSKDDSCVVTQANEMKKQTEYSLTLAMTFNYVKCVGVNLTKHLKSHARINVYL